MLGDIDEKQELWYVVFTPQPLRALGYCLHPCYLDRRAGGGKEFVRAVSQKL